MALQTHFSDLKPYFPAQYQGVSDLQTTARGFHPSLHQMLPFNDLYIPSVPDAVHALPPMQNKGKTDCLDIPCADD